jgi:polyhydroxyalkanoate synthase subunit PhaC
VSGGPTTTALQRPQRRRLGPRPLPLHLTTAATLWLTSRAGSGLSRSGLLSWRPELAETGRALQSQLAAADPERFAEALDREIRRSADAFLRGLERYRSHPYTRDVAEPPAIWSEGTTRLLDYGPEGGAPVLVVPSLINRAYVLDLDEEKSLLRFLAAEGLRPLLVDWGAPGEAERRFDVTDYVAGRLEAAFEAAVDAAGGPLLVMGYCMGGTLALGLALRRRRETAGLALLAAPWDFHAEAEPQARLLGSLAEPLAATFAAWGELPVDVLQALFAALDPLLALKKFTSFANRDPESAEAHSFVALEDWLNDGVPLALPTAREALSSWYGANASRHRTWRIAGRIVEPAEFDRPALVVVPSRDRIVPPASASALAVALPRARLLKPPLGHIGMVMGSGAKRAVWRPLADFLHEAAAGAGWTRA